jgi:DNA-binding winged helix-turn-helix (wHTH) protein
VIIFTALSPLELILETVGCRVLTVSFVFSEEEEGAESRTGGSVRVRFADYSLDTEARQLFQGAREVHLSPKAFELLKVLVENRPKALSKNELLERIWPGVFVSDASLARSVSEIRDAIGDHSRTDGFLRTVHGFGYAFATAGVSEPPTPVAPVDGPVCWLVGRNLEFRVLDGEHLVGREPGVSIWLDSPKVSRNHARVVVSGREVSIEDLASKNGTFVGGVRITEATRLNPGDEIQIGPIRLVFKVVEGPGSTETEVWSREPL